MTTLKFVAPAKAGAQGQRLPIVLRLFWIPAPAPYHDTGSAGMTKLRFVTKQELARPPETPSR